MKNTEEWEQVEKIISESYNDFSGVLDVAGGAEKIIELLRHTREEARKEERTICRKIYIDNVDWSEWAVSDEKAGELFDDARKKLEDTPSK